MNRPRETLRYFERLDPRSGWMRQGWEYYWYLTAQMKHMVGDLAGTRSWLAEARKRYPENVAIAAAYARALALTGNPEQVAPIVREILQSDNYLRVFYAYSILADLQRHNHDQDAASVYTVVSSWYAAKRASVTEADRIDMGKILFAMHMNADAEKQFRKLLADFPESIYVTPVTGHVAVLTAMRGDTTTALRLMAALPEDNQQTFWRARLASELGHRKEAVDLLARAFKEGFPQISLSHSTWYDFPKLQGYPPFEALVASDR
jgi:predicted Zn-dependent protease